MSNSHEIIADIAAEKRRIAKEIRDHASNGDYWDKKRANETAEDLEEEADRLEAAHKRELSKNGADFGQLGNCAKLREAVGALLAWAEGNLRLTPDLLKDGTRECSEFVAMCCKSALAAPARNCDHFASAEEAWDAYDEWVDSYRSKGKTEPFNEFGWLFAPATEKEGGIQ